VALNIYHSADTGSNKPAKYSVQLIAQAYHHDRPTGYRVTVLKPKVDRLSVTLSVNDSTVGKQIRDHLADMASSGAATMTKWKKSKGWGSGKYDRSYSLNVGSESSALVQCASVTAPVSLLRFEFNPSGLGPAGAKAFRESIPDLTAHHFDFEALAAEGTVTRVDIAVDLVNIDIEDLLINTAKPGVTNGYFGITGKAETKYLNVNKSGSNLYVYDRRALLAKLQQDGEKALYGGAKYTRVEVRSNPNIPLTAMDGMSNRLLKVDLFDIEAASPPEKFHHWKLFQDSCRYRGLKGALALLPAGTRAAYEAAIKATDTLWRPKELWSHWPSVLKNAGLVGGD